MLAEKPGVRAANADDEAKRLMVEDPQLRAALVRKFGEETILDDGSLNRAGLAERVFGNPAEVQALNALVHPVVREALMGAIEQAKRDGIILFIYEVALITETDVAEVFDAILLVDASVETRIARVMARNRISRGEVLARMSHQKPPDVLRPLADYLIENAGSLDLLRGKVDDLFSTLVDL